MRFQTRDKPKINSTTKSTKKEGGFEGWKKCPGCGELIHQTQCSNNFNCCPKCHEHYPLSAKDRIKLLADQGTFQEKFSTILPRDPLNFVDTESYKERLKSAAKKSGSSEAVIVGECRIGGVRAALGVLDFSFMGGSMGSVVGERLTSLIEYALAEGIPLVTVAASGGARMQESIFSLMQMAKTSFALARLHEAKIPYISILTNPTSGGVTASFASLGDIIIAEPKALICFAGPRVVEQVIRHKLPENAQKSEFLLEHGMIDFIVLRRDLKSKLAALLDFLI